MSPTIEILNPRQLGGEWDDNSGPFRFEEEKQSMDDLDATHHILQVLHAQPLFFCFTFGFLIYAILMYNFMLNEWAHIRDNPKVQYHKKLIKDEEDEFITERREAYKQMQKKRRLEKRAYLRQERDKKLMKMDKKKRKAHVEKHQRIRMNMMLEEELKFQQALKIQSKPLETRDEMMKVRKMIHRDVAAFYKMCKGFTKEKPEDTVTDSDEDLKNIEQKVYYGSDSDGSYFEGYQKFLESGQDNIIIDSILQEMMKEGDEAKEIDPEEQMNMIDDSDFGLIYKGRGHMNDPSSYGHINERLNFELEHNMQFDDEEEEVREDTETRNEEEQSDEMNFQGKVDQQIDSSMDSKSSSYQEYTDELQVPSEQQSGNTTPRSSQRSRRIIEFDDDDQLIEMQNFSQMKPQKASAVGVEFKPKRNSDISKAEKQRLKRMRQRERKHQEILEQEAKEKARAAKAAKENSKMRKGKDSAFQDMMIESEDMKAKTKKKLIPKKTVVDDTGAEWEVIDKKRQFEVVDDSDEDYA